MRFSPTVFGAVVTLAASLALSSPGFADTVTHRTDNARSMVDLCNAGGGNGTVTEGAGYCYGKDGKSFTFCGADPHGVDNCTTIIKTRTLPKSYAPAAQFESQPDFAG